jgi:zeaxanthin epoxidase
VQILEKTSKFARFGGPIQLASNALATIKGIDEGVFERVMSKFTFTGTRMNGIKDGIRTEWYTKFEAITKLAEYFKLPYTGVIDRPDLQEIMLEEVGGDKTVRTDSTFQSFEQLPNNEGVRVTLADGTVVEADILVGCDGIWSAVRSQLWNEPAKGPDSGCTYSGYTCFAADTVQRTDYYFDVGYQVYIGPGKYFVTSDVGRGRTQWYAFLALPPGSKSRASNKEYLYDLFSKGKEGRWTDELFKVLDATPDDAIEQRDLYDRPPSVLKPWSKGHVTLMGDAVHPMMPNLGQGGGQAIEDAYVLAERLGALKSRSQIPGALTGFYLSRLPRTAIVQGLSRIASDLIVSAFDTPFQVPPLSCSSKCRARGRDASPATPCPGPGGAPSRAASWASCLPAGRPACALPPAPCSRDAPLTPLAVADSSDGASRDYSTNRTSRDGSTPGTGRWEGRGGSTTSSRRRSNPSCPESSTRNSGTSTPSRPSSAQRRRSTASLTRL